MAGGGPGRRGGRDARREDHLSGRSTKWSAGARFLGARLLGRYAPLGVYWKITWRCNARCAYCGVHERVGAPELDTVELTTRMTEARRAGMYRVNLSGGEPLVRADLGALVQHLTALGVSVGIDTNGLLVPDRLDDVRRVDSVLLSVDGDAAVHDAQRGAGQFARTYRAGEVLKRAGVKLMLNCVITTRNHDRLGGVLAVADSLDASVAFQPATPWLHDSRAPNPLAPDNAQMRAVVRFLRAPPRHGARVANTRAYLAAIARFPELAPLPCPGGRIGCVVNPDGWVGACDFGVPADPWRDPRAAGGFGAAFAQLPRPPRCRRCSCATTMNMQHALSFDLLALWDIWRRY